MIELAQSSVGSEVSFLAVICVVTVTVALVLLTLLCICGNRTGSLNTKSKNLSTVTNDVVAYSQLDTAADVGIKVNDGTNHNASSAVGEVKIDVSADHPKDAQPKEDNFPAVHMSPHLPPRNLHPPLRPVPSVDSLSAPPPASESSTKDKGASVKAANPVIVLEKASDADGAKGFVAGASSCAKGTLTVAGPSQCRPGSKNSVSVNPDYEEVKFEQTSKPSVENKADAFADREYDYIDLRESTAKKPGASGTSAHYAEIHSDDPKVSSGEPQSDKLVNEVPPYAKVDKSRKRHSFSAKLLMASSSEEGASGQEALNSDRRLKSGSGFVIYSEVKKEKKTEADNRETTKGTGISDARGCTSSVNGVGGVALDQCNAVGGPKSDAGRSRASAPPRKLEEPDYSVISDERPDVLLNLDPAYSTIYESRAENSASPAGAASNLSSGRNPTKDDDVYEVVDYEESTAGISQNSVRPNTNQRQMELASGISGISLQIAGSSAVVESPYELLQDCETTASQNSQNGIQLHGAERRAEVGSEDNGDEVHDKSVILPKIGNDNTGSK